MTTGRDSEGHLAPSVDVQGMFNRIAGRYDLANRVMSAGVDVLWRKKALKPLLEGLPAEAVVLDLGAGTMDGALEIARRRPGLRIVAADFSRGMLVSGLPKIQDVKQRITPQAADAQNLPYARNVFAAAFTAFCIRNVADLDRGLEELNRVIQPGKQLAVLEFFKPTRRRPFFDGLWNKRALPLLGGALTGDSAAYRYLPESIERFDTRGDFQARMTRAGFREVRGQDLFPAGVASLVTGVAG